MTGGGLPAQAGPVGIAGVVQAVAQRLPVVRRASEGRIDRDAAPGGMRWVHGPPATTGTSTGKSSAAAALGDAR